ncbi:MULTISPECIES: acyl-CoA thioesterase domain-containing protein [Ferrimonas]|uniref:acyl-CoA thioesterase domain-containing protein n=1 Tax=Ferrimonas TaxID=44011 RepID=UPI0004187094|nr:MULTISPECIES: acyl-CoA thioesterase domain-containing protein [Ferrimonas]USD36733.1 thioesterase family protein [Ferrimonas sp. SCSIO 43195]
MSNSLDTLLEIMTLEQLEQGLFRGQSQDLGFGHLFGGQVLGQALAAATQTVADDRQVHSFHSYFLRAGDLQRPVIYEVENMRDGGSISTRRVSAIQHGRPIFHLTGSFHHSEPGFEHQAAMPDVAGPDGLANQFQLAEAMRGKVPDKLLDIYLNNTAIEIRLVDPINPLKPEPREPVRYVWMKANGPLPSNQSLQQHLLAYASDLNFLVTAAQPHGVSYLTPGLKMATIDHSMWFHRPVAFDQWLLYAVDSPNAMNSRGLVRGQIFNQQGQLVASSAQEGLLRQMHRKS